VRKRILVPLALLVPAALMLAACGGSGNSSSPEEERITEAIEQSATTSDPGNCTEVQTLAFNEQSGATEGKGATEVCEEEAERDQAEQAESVSVSNISVEGESATAEVEFEGGALNSQTVKRSKRPTKKRNRTV